MRSGCRIKSSHNDWAVTDSHKLGLQYIKFFDSLTKMIERVGDHLSYLPVYSSDIFEIYPNIKKVVLVSST